MTRPGPLDREQMLPAYFRRTPEGFEPLDLARSDWAWEQLHGVALGGLLAVAAEDEIRAAGRGHFVPVRFHMDMFRPSRAETTQVATTVVRSGRRLTLVDVTMLQGGRPTARASVQFVEPSTDPPGEVWRPSDRPAVPPESLVPQSEDRRPPFIRSAEEWSTDFTAHQNAARHETWNTACPIIIDEPISLFAAAASVADMSNMVSNWGSAGIGFINADISLTLARLPVSMEIGLRALDHVQHDGVAVTAAEMFDRKGPLGTTTLTAISNAANTIDYNRES